MRVLFSLILIGIFSFSNAQKGEFICYVSPIKAKIELDGSVILNTTKIQIDTGVHILKVSFDRYVSEEISIKIQSDSLNRIYVRMKRDPIYLQYEKDLSYYKSKQKAGVAIPLIVLGVDVTGFLTALILNKRKINEQYDLVKLAEKDYYSNINYVTIEDSKADFYLKQQKYSKYINRRNFLQTSGAVLTSAFVGITIYSVIRVINRKKPTYESEEVSTFFLSPYYNKNGSFGLNLIKSF